MLTLYKIATLFFTISSQIIRIPDEEQMLMGQFGEAYRAYMKKTKRLIPYLI